MFATIKPPETFSGQETAIRQACMHVALISVIMMGVMGTLNSSLIPHLGESHHSFGHLACPRHCLGPEQEPARHETVGNVPPPCFPPMCGPSSLPLPSFTHVFPPWQQSPLLQGRLQGEGVSLRKGQVPSSPCFRGDDLQ